jgi:hypothetical protein
MPMASIRGVSLSCLAAIAISAAVAAAADEKPKSPARVEMMAGDALGLEIFGEELAAPAKTPEKVAASPPAPPAPPAKRASDDD